MYVLSRGSTFMDKGLKSICSLFFQLLPEGSQLSLGHTEDSILGTQELAPSAAGFYLNLVKNCEHHQVDLAPCRGLGPGAENLNVCPFWGILPSALGHLCHLKDVAGWKALLDTSTSNRLTSAASWNPSALKFNWNSGQ